jgi:hypothetical protein
MSKLRGVIAILVMAFAPVMLPAQEAASVSGRVTNAQGQPESAVAVRIESLSVGTHTAQDGSYTMNIPGSRIRPGQEAELSASRTGLVTISRTITFSPGTYLTQNFQIAAEQQEAVTDTRGSGEKHKNSEKHKNNQKNEQKEKNEKKEKHEKKEKN